MGPSTTYDPRRSPLESGIPRLLDYTMTIPKQQWGLLALCSTKVAEQRLHHPTIARPPHFRHLRTDSTRKLDARFWNGVQFEISIAVAVRRCFRCDVGL